MSPRASAEARAVRISWSRMGRWRRRLSESTAARSPMRPRAPTTASRIAGLLPELALARSMAARRPCTTWGLFAGCSALMACAARSARRSESLLPTWNWSAERSAGTARRSWEPARISMASLRVETSSGCAVKAVATAGSTASRNCLTCGSSTLSGGRAVESRDWNISRSLRIAAGRRLSASSFLTWVAGSFSSSQPVAVAAPNARHVISVSRERSPFVRIAVPRMELGVRPRGHWGREFGRGAVRPRRDRPVRPSRWP